MVYPRHSDKKKPKSKVKVQIKKERVMTASKKNQDDEEDPKPKAEEKVEKVAEKSEAKEETPQAKHEADALVDFDPQQYALASTISRSLQAKSVGGVDGVQAEKQGMDIGVILQLISQYGPLLQGLIASLFHKKKDDPV